MARRRSRGLGAPSKAHAQRVEQHIDRANRALNAAERERSCTRRLNELGDAIARTGKAWAHAFESGGRTRRGAITPNTTGDDLAADVAKMDQRVTKALTRFHAECVVKQPGLDGPRLRRRKRRR